VVVARLGDVAWVGWPAGAEAVVSCLRTVPGVEFFADRGGRWFRFGSRLPAPAAPPLADAVPLDRVLFPARVEPVPPPAALPAPVPLTVVRGGGPRPVTAVRCVVSALARWADAATTAELAAVRAARCGDRALLLGGRLPVVAGGERFWGDRVLVPVGFRPEPALPDGVIRAACGVELEELLILDAAGAEAVPDAAFAPLTRAGVRLALSSTPLPQSGERGRG
jgi:hypothetical protein